MFYVVYLLIISCPKIKDSLTIPPGGGAVTSTCFTSPPSFTSPPADIGKLTFVSSFFNEFFATSNPLLSCAVGLLDNPSFSFSTSGLCLGFRRLLRLRGFPVFITLPCLMSIDLISFTSSSKCRNSWSTQTFYKKEFKTKYWNSCSGQIYQRKTRILNNAERYLQIYIF